jgi:hypothetical protein
LSFFLSPFRWSRKLPTHFFSSPLFEILLASYCILMTGLLTSIKLILSCFLSFCLSFG